MSEDQYTVVVNVDGFTGTNIPTQENNYGIEIWSNCISNEFPIFNMIIDDEIATCDIAQPHDGCIMIAMVDEDDKLDGEAKIFDPDNNVLAVFYYEKGEATGQCKLYYQSGELYFDGYLKNGYRTGVGTEYDSDGIVIFSGLYKDGLRINNIQRNKSKRHYWNEVDNKGNIISICKKDRMGLNDGTCYFFADKEITKISEWKNGKEVNILHTFARGEMTSYYHGQIIYKGPYARISQYRYILTSRRIDIIISCRR